MATIRAPFLGKERIHEFHLVQPSGTTVELGRGPCTLYVGALNRVGGVASWARVFASCAS
jgi:hypothetical protein